MKIIDTRKKQTARFDSLDVGVVFIENNDGDEYVQIKIRELEDRLTGYFNAVSLATGEPYYIEPDALVEIVNAELRIV